MTGGIVRHCIPRLGRSDERFPRDRQRIRSYTACARGGLWCSPAEGALAARRPLRACPQCQRLGVEARAADRAPRRRPLRSRLSAALVRLGRPNDQVFGQFWRRGPNIVGLQGLRRDPRALQDRLPPSAEGGGARRPGGAGAPIEANLPQHFRRARGRRPPIAQVHREGDGDRPRVASRSSPWRWCAPGVSRQRFAQDLQDMRFAARSSRATRPEARPACGWRGWLGDAWRAQVIIEMDLRLEAPPSPSSPTTPRAIFEFRVPKPSGTSPIARCSPSNGSTHQAQQARGHRRRGHDASRSRASVIQGFLRQAIRDGLLPRRHAPRQPLRRRARAAGGRRHRLIGPARPPRAALPRPEILLGFIQRGLRQGRAGARGGLRPPRHPLLGLRPGPPASGSRPTGPGPTIDSCRAWLAAAVRGETATQNGNRVELVIQKNHCRSRGARRPPTRSRINDARPVCRVDDANLAPSQRNRERAGARTLFGGPGPANHPRAPRAVCRCQLEGAPRRAQPGAVLHRARRRGRPPGAAGRGGGGVGDRDRRW